MATLLYFVQLSLYAGVMWGIYCIVWRNRPLHAYSRFYLLASLVLPAILPFIHLPVNAQHAVAAYSVTLPEVSLAAVRNAPLVREFSWPVVIAWLYAAAGILLAALYIRAYFRLSKQLKHGRRTNYDGYAIITGTAIGPGTLGRRIFFPGGEVDPLIVRHELAHIHSRHRYDCLLLQLLHVIFWASPAHWLIGRELKVVHEFEADRTASEGIDTADYAALLLSESLGIRQSLVLAHSFFHHPLKRRMMMLQKIKSRKRTILLLAAIALTAGFMSSALLANPRKPVRSRHASFVDSAAMLLDMDILARNTPPKSGEIRTLSDGTIVFKTVETSPAFNGRLQDWLVKNLHYPDSTRANNAMNGCLVEFIVATDGQIIRPHVVRSSGDAGLDDEAIRTVSSMPNWKPGMQKGKPVPVVFTLGIFFKPGQGC